MQGQAYLGAARWPPLPQLRWRRAAAAAAVLAREGVVVGGQTRSPSESPRERDDAMAAWAV